jgi:hypothetical protein
VGKQGGWGNAKSEEEGNPSLPPLEPISMFLIHGQEGRGNGGHIFELFQIVMKTKRTSLYIRFVY